MKNRRVGIALFCTALIAATWWIGSHLTLATVVQQEKSVRNLITEHPVTSWVLGFFIYTLIALVPGTRGKAVVSGWLFGFWPGLVLVNGSLTLAAFIGFLVSRHLFRDSIISRYAQHLERINQPLKRNAAFYVILLRVVPVSFSLTNYLLGATRLDRKTYWWATQLGLLPGNVIFVNAGARLPSLNELVQQGWSVMFSWDVVVGIILLSCFALFVPWLVNRWMRESGTLGSQRGHAHL